MMDLGLTGRRAFVTASSDGLGLATARALATEGARVALCGRDGEKVAKASEQLPAGAGVGLVGDLIADPDRLVEEAAKRLGGLDILVVNTGGARHGGLLAQQPADWDAGYHAVLRPALALVRAAVPFLRHSSAGRVVFITARSVLETSPDLALSGVFRSGVVAAARVLAEELAPRVLVNVVVPGMFDTGALHRRVAALADVEHIDASTVRDRLAESVPLGRIGEPRELADVVAFLCSARASYQTGSVVRVDGGAVRGY